MPATATIRPIDMKARLTRAQEELLERRDQAAAALELRDELVHQAVDEGMTTSAVARALPNSRGGHMTQSAVMKILAKT